MIASHSYSRRLALRLLLLFCIQLRYSCDSYVLSPPMPCFHHNNYFSASLELPLPIPLITDKETSTSSSRIPVLYTNDPAHLTQWLAKNIPTDGCCSIGFDIEAVAKLPRRKAPFVGPAVVQLSTTQSAVVVHLVNTNGTPNGACRSLLERVLLDDQIVKVGCGVDMDMVELRSTWDSCEARSRFDVGRAFDRPQPAGLKTLAAEVLGRDLPKPLHIVLSDWSQFPLSAEQVSYAALDAWVGAAVCEALAHRDPETFSNQRLAAFLQSQTSIEELHRRHMKRIKAKHILEGLAGLQKDSPRPSWKARLVRELNSVRRANKHYQPQDHCQQPSLQSKYRMQNHTSVAVSPAP